MKGGRSNPEYDLYRKLKWLIFFRALFAAVLLGSVFLVILRAGKDLLLLAHPLFDLFGVAAALLVLSIVYSIFLPRVKRLVFFGYVQIIIDTVFVSFVIFLTGCFSSIFSFLYLVVIVCSSMVIFQRGGMITATICCIQYGIMIDLEYYNILKPFGFDANFLVVNYNWHYVLYRLIITIGACYAVALLSGYLAEQERQAKKDLWAMEGQMKRVEKLAAIGEIAAGMAHEIKNPLASLRGSIQMLRESIPYEPVHDKLMHIILREADRLSGLVSEFLIFARPQAGKVQTILIGKVLEETINLLKADPKCKEKIRIIGHIDANLYARIDPEHLRQVMWNLLNNAAEAITDDGQIEVSLYPQKKTDACISVSDNGCGIGKDDIDSVFDPFFSTKPKGTGLGLSIIQQIISAYDGFIDIASTPGKGTTVTVKLKRVPPPPSAASDPAAVSDNENTRSASISEGRTATKRLDTGRQME